MGWRKVEFYEHTPGCGGALGALIIFLIVMAAIRNSGGLTSPPLSQSGGAQNGPVVQESPNSAPHPLLGIHFLPIDLGNGSIGMQIVYVYSGSPAYRVGLEPGDIIVFVDGKPFFTQDDLSLALDRSNGRPVLTVFRVRYGQYVDVLTPLN